MGIDNHLNEHQLSLLSSKDFIETIGICLETLLSTHIRKAALSIMKENSKIRLVRKFTLLTVNYGQMNLFEQEIAKYFNYLLEKTIQNEHYAVINLKEADIDNDVHYTDRILEGSLLTVARRAMLSNNILPPVIIEKHAKMNKIGQPLHYPIGHTTSNNDTPSLVLYIGSYHHIYILSVIACNDYLKKT